MQQALLDTESLSPKVLSALHRRSLAAHTHADIKLLRTQLRSSVLCTCIGDSSANTSDNDPQSTLDMTLQGGEHSDLPRDLGLLLLTQVPLGDGVDARPLKRGETNWSSCF